MRVLRLQFR